MPYELKQWPQNVYPDEIMKEFPEALEDIDVALRALRMEGPSPDGFTCKPLGKSKASLWQMNLRVQGRQIRILYAPSGRAIVVFRIHKKSSPQEQERAYDLAITRKKQAERIINETGIANVRSITVH